MKSLLSLCLIVFVVGGYCRAYKILALLPYHIRSHYLIYDPLLIELANRGHQVTVVNPFPKPSAAVKIPNYTEISLKECYPNTKFAFSIDTMVNVVSSIYLATIEMSGYIDEDERLYKNCLPIIQLIKSNERYDLVMTELFITDSFLPFVKKFQAPWVGLTANVLTPWLADRIGAVDNPSYVPMFFNNRPMDPRTPTFYQRLYNVYTYVAYKIAFYTVLAPKSQKVAEKYMSRYADEPLSNIVKNVSIVLSYSHFLTNTPRPQLPIVKQIGGIHVKEAKPLIEDIKKFLDNAEHGVIYFSMGSLLQTSTFPEDKTNAFLRAFAKLPQRVLWKWEGEFPNQTANIKTMEWTPQRDILAHPNVKLFISHGGALGLNEAIYEGVPVLGIPIYTDQRINIMMLKAAGSGDVLDYAEISDEVVFEKLHNLLNDPSYAENAKKLSTQYKDRDLSAMDTAVYWIEYVVRHNGARHLRSASADLAWYQYFLLDVIAFITIVVICSLLILFYSIKSIICYARRKILTYFCKLKRH